MTIPDALPKAIDAGKSFIVSTHINPDADGVGASVALCWLLQKLGRRAQIVNSEHLPDNFRFLEGLFPIEKDLSMAALSADTWMVLDASRLSRTGFQPPDQPLCILNIDHHADNERFGSCNWVDSKAPAVSEMVYWLIREFGFFPDPEIAEALYAGILIDTGGFKFSNTGIRAFRVCAELAENGLDCEKVYKRVFMDKSLGRLHLEGEIFRTCALELDGRVCIMQVTEATFRETGTGQADLEGISNLSTQLKGVEVGVVLIRREGRTKACLRSNGTVNVGKVAACFGGGGHAAAAGCTLDASIEETRKRILAEVAQILS